jgi:excisionase family DNA binding protein
MPKTPPLPQDDLHGGLQPVTKVAEFLSLSRSKVYDLMDSGHLPYVKLGKSRRVRWADVLRLVERHTFGSASPDA